MHGQIYSDLIASATVFINWSVNIRMLAIHGHQHIKTMLMNEKSQILMLTSGQT